MKDDNHTKYHKFPLYWRQQKMKVRSLCESRCAFLGHHELFVAAVVATTRHQTDETKKGAWFFLAAVHGSSPPPYSWITTLAIYNGTKWKWKYKGFFFSSYEKRTKEPSFNFSRLGIQLGVSPYRDSQLGVCAVNEFARNPGIVVNIFRVPVLFEFLNRTFS